VIVIEDFFQEKYGSFNGSKALQKYEECHREGFIDADQVEWSISGIRYHRLGKPRSGVFLSRVPMLGGVGLLLAASWLAS
jgi:hypothetical protein